MDKKRIHYLSLASVISAFAVVMLHVNECFWNFSTERYWFTANIIESVMYFAVPVFFMISGATLIDYRKRYSTKEYLKKRISKTVLPFIIWSLIGIAYRVYRGWQTVRFDGEGIREIILSVINVKAVSIYWFFIALFSVYLCIPLFSAIKEELREEVFLFLIVVAFIFNSVLPFVASVFQIEYTQRVTVTVVSGYLLWVLLGYLIHKREISKPWRIGIYLFAIVGLLMHIVGTYMKSMAIGSVDSTYKGYLNVPCVLYSVGVFVFLKEIGQKIQNENLIKILNFLNSYTFAVYLIHWFVIRELVKRFSIEVNSIVYRLGAPFIIFVICIIIAWLLRKIPILKKIVP